MGNILAEYDTKGEIANETTRDFISRCAKAVLISRTVLGVDKLTGESIKLFASKKDFERLTEIEIDHFKKMYDEKNA